MIGRRQLPVYSPLTLAALGKAVAGGGTSRRAERAVEELRLHLSNRFEADDCWLLDSGTHALQVALLAAAERGRTVALPAYCCYDVATAALGSRVEVLLYDVDPWSLTPDLEGVESALSEGATAVVAANLYGHPLPWTELRTLCRQHGAVLIEDAAQGVGSEWEGRPGGSFGDLTVLSFGRGKGWTGGGGGALLARGGSAGEAVRGCWEPDWDDRPGAASSGALGAKSLAQWLLGRPLLYGLPAALPWLHLGETVFKEPTSPEGITALSARLVLETSAMARREVSLRRTNARAWTEGLSPLESPAAAVRACAPLDEGISGYLRWPALVGDESRAIELSTALTRWGVARGYPTTLSALPAMASIRVRNDHLVGADTLARRLVTFPTHRLVTDGDRSALFRALPAGKS